MGHLTNLQGRAATFHTLYRTNLFMYHWFTQNVDGFKLCYAKLLCDQRYFLLQHYCTLKKNQILYRNLSCIKILNTLDFE